MTIIETYDRFIILNLNRIFYGKEFVIRNYSDIFDIIESEEL